MYSLRVDVDVSVVFGGHITWAKVVSNTDYK